MLTNWYVRRSRDRFWAGERDAIDTLHTVLEVTCRLAAPLLPLTTEVVWRGLTGQRSVHLAQGPDPAALPHDRDLVASMDRMRQVVSAALSVRKARGLRVRQPLPQLIVAVQQARKQASLDVTDRIVLTVDAPAPVAAVAKEHEHLIAGEVLAQRVDYEPALDGFAGTVGENVAVRVRVAVVSA